MCKINCSGGCPACAPEEHADLNFYTWFKYFAGREWYEAAPDEEFFDSWDIKNAFEAGQKSVLGKGTEAEKEEKLDTHTR